MRKLVRIMALKSQPLEFYNYYKDIENGDEMVDCRLELLIDTFGPDIPYIIMTFLNAIYSILNTTFMLDIFYNTNAGTEKSKKMANCSCSIYFNRNNEIANENKTKSEIMRIPFECLVEVSWKIGDTKVLKYKQCKAKISTAFVDKNAKLNVEQTQRITADDIKYKQNILMECIVITLIDKPDMEKEIVRVSHNEFESAKLWREEYVIESDALGEYLYTNEEYGPIYYRKQDKWSGVTVASASGPSFN